MAKAHRMLGLFVGFLLLDPTAVVWATPIRDSGGFQASGPVIDIGHLRPVVGARIGAFGAAPGAVGYISFDAQKGGDPGDTSEARAPKSTNPTTQEDSFTAGLHGYVGDDVSSEVSLRWFAKRMLDIKNSLKGNANPAASGNGSVADGGFEIGLDLLESLLQVKVDKELAISVLSYATEVRQYLPSASGYVGERNWQSATTSGGSMSWSNVRNMGSVASILDESELARIEMENSDRKVNSIKDFLLNLLIDFRTISMFSLSILTVLAGAALLTRWMRT